MKQFGYAVKLSKSNGSGKDSFVSFGYYSSIEFSLMRSLEHALDRSNGHNGSPGGYDSNGKIMQKQEIILMDLGLQAQRENADNPLPEDLKEYDDRMKSGGVCCVSFLLFDETKTSFVSSIEFEKQARTLKAIACNILNNKQKCLSVNIRFFSTLGASGIAMMLLPADPANPGEFFTHALAFIREFRQRGEAAPGMKGTLDYRLIYSFSVLCFSGNADLSRFENVYMPHVQVYMQAGSNSKIPSFAATLRKQLNIKANDQSAPLILLAGADDYLLEFKDVNIRKIFELYNASELMNGQGVCQSVYLSLGEGISYQKEEPLPKKVDVPRKKNNHDGEIDISSQIRWLRDNKRYDLAQALEGLLQNYECLRQSYYTTWFCATYQEIIELFARIIQASADKYKGELEEANTYFNEFVSMFERLSFKNAFSTDSPGFHKLQDDFSPRMLLAYNKLLNGLLKAWNEYNNGLQKATRKELHGEPCKGVIPKALEGVKPNKLDEFMGQDLSFVTIGNIGGELRTTLFNRECPPDTKLLNIHMPTDIALRPYIAIPGVLHELGHAIGPRRRISRIGYFIDTMTDLICRFLCGGESAYTWFSAPIASRDPFDNILGRAVYVNRESFKKILVERFNARYSEAQKAMEGEIDERRLEYAQCWSNGLTDISRRTLHDLPDDYPFLVDVMIKSYGQYHKDNDFKIPDMEHLQQELSRRWRLLKRHLLNREPAIVDLGYHLYDELAADMFMVQCTNMSADQYLQFSFLMYDAVTYPDKKINNLMYQQTELTRLFLVLDVCIEAKKVPQIGDSKPLPYIADDTDRLEAYKEFLEDIGLKYRYYQRATKDKSDVLAVWNMCMSFGSLRDYMEKLKGDERWLKTEPASGDEKAFKLYGIKKKWKDLFDMAWKMGEHQDQVELQHQFLKDFLYTNGK